MTRKDYVLIAEALQCAIVHCRSNAEVKGVEVAARELAACLAQDNARFDRPRFLTACGVRS